jgi:Arc/MetJ-type ribon-helix-helix transcriptional regulator
MPTITVRVSEGMKAEIETLVADTGLWRSESIFIREALDTLIKRYWHGERFCQRPQLEATQDAH